VNLICHNRWSLHWNGLARILGSLIKRWKKIHRLHNWNPKCRILALNLAHGLRKQTPFRPPCWWAIPIEWDWLQELALTVANCIWFSHFVLHTRSRREREISGDRAAVKVLECHRVPTHFLLRHFSLFLETIIII
jgi:hypothetical protein